MKISNRHVYFVFILIGSFFCLLSKQFSVPSKKHNQPCSSTLNELAILERNAWEGLAPYDISQEKCAELQKTEYNRYQKASQREFAEPVSTETKALIQPILKEFGLSKDFPLIKWNSHIAAASDYLIYINEEELLRLPKNVQLFVVAHEMQHVLHQDHSALFFIFNTLYQQEKFNETELPYEHPFLAYRRFIETRADILVATKSSVWAERYQEYAEFMVQLMNGDTGDSFHPQNSERLQFAQNIKQQFAGLQQTTA